MIVLHAAVSAADGRLRLWAEAPPDDEAGLPADVLPFDAGPERLADAIDATPGGFRPEAARIHPGRAWLPSRGRRPVPSTPLVAPDPGGRGGLRLRPWCVSVLALDPEEALTLLTSLDPPGSARRTVAARSRPHVPRTEREPPGELRAVWRPVFPGDAAARFAALVGGMPPSARALEPDEEGSEEEPPGSPPRDVTRAFLDGLTDHLVRSAAWGGFAPPPAPSAPAASPDAGWMRALRSAEPALAANGSGAADLRRRVSPRTPRWSAAWTPSRSGGASAPSSRIWPTSTRAASTQARELLGTELEQGGPPLLD